MYVVKKPKMPVLKSQSVDVFKKRKNSAITHEERKIDAALKKEDEFSITLCRLVDLFQSELVINKQLVDVSNLCKCLE